MSTTKNTSRVKVLHQDFFKLYPGKLCNTGTYLTALCHVTEGDFVVGNRALFYELLMPKVVETVRIKDSGHLLMYDQPVQLANQIHKFITKN